MLAQKVWRLVSPALALKMDLNFIRPTLCCRNLPGSAVMLVICGSAASSNMATGR